MIRAHLDKLLTVVTAGVLAGLLLAAAALPAALVFGIGFTALSGPYSELPNTLRTPPTAQRSNLYANDGTTLITSFYQEDRVDVPLNEVAPVMRQAIVAAEDVRFYQHSGVDVRGVLFDDDERVLLMQERSDGRWCPPGGWADPLDTPRTAVLREVREESGYAAEVVKLFACWERDVQGHVPPLPVSLRS